MGIVNAAANHRVNVDVKLGVLGKPLKTLIESLQALLRNVVRLYVVDGNLHVVQPGLVQALDAVHIEQISVRDHARKRALAADVADQIVQLGMQQRFAAAERDN